MNWSKAKTILIVALIITDLFLIFTYSGISFKSDDFADNESLVEFLAQKNIDVGADMIPLRHRDMPVLFVQKEEIDDEVTDALISFASAEDPLLRGAGEAGYMGAADSYLASYIEMFEGEQASAVFEEITEGAAVVRVERDEEYTKVIYSNTVAGNGESIPIENSHLTFTFKDGIINDVECEWLSAVNFHNRKQKTISAAQALLLFLASETTARDDAESAVQVNADPNTTPESGEKIHIDRIEMIYWLDESSLDTETTVSADTALPVWKITYTRYKEATQIREAAYIDAYEHQ